MDLRDKAGKLIYEADLDFGENTKVSDLVDIMMEFGKYCADLGFTEGLSSTLIHTTREEFIRKYFERKV